MIQILVSKKLVSFGFRVVGINDHFRCGSLGYWQNLLPDNYDRHTGMDCRYLEHRDVKRLSRPWILGSGIPCRNDGVLNLLYLCGSNSGSYLQPNP